jgi:hypothetical protein
MQFMPSKAEALEKNKKIFRYHTPSTQSPDNNEKNICNLATNGKSSQTHEAILCGAQNLIQREPAMQAESVLKPKTQFEYGIQMH